MTGVALRVSPYDDMILVDPDLPPTETEGGIVLPDSIKNKPPVRGLIVGVGPGKLLDDGTRTKMDVEEGDRIFFSRYTGTELELDNTKLVIMRRDEILALLKPLPKKEEKGGKVVTP